MWANILQQSKVAHLSNIRMCPSVCQYTIEMNSVPFYILYVCIRFGCVHDWICLFIFRIFLYLSFALNEHFVLSALLHYSDLVLFCFVFFLSRRPLILSNSTDIKNKLWQNHTNFATHKYQTKKDVRLRTSHRIMLNVNAIYRLETKWNDVVDDDDSNSDSERKKIKKKTKFAF